MYMILLKVLQHLVEDNNGDFAQIEQTLMEANRVMTDDGLLAVVSILSYGAKESVWWLRLLPQLTKRALTKFPTIEEWERIFSRSQFRCVSKLAILGPEVFGDFYLDAEGPLKKEWRNANSYFALATDNEINEVEEKINTMKNDGTLEQWIKANDKTNEMGTVCVLICKRVG